MIIEYATNKLDIPLDSSLSLQAKALDKFSTEMP